MWNPDRLVRCVNGWVSTFLSLSFNFDSSLIFFSGRRGCDFNLPLSLNCFCFFLTSATSTLPSRIGAYWSIISFIRFSNSSSDRSSSLPVLIIFCSIYNPAALPLATSALTAADQAPFFKASCLILPNSVMCLSKVTAYFFWYSSLSSPIYLTTNGYFFGFCN